MYDPYNHIATQKLAWHASPEETHRREWHALARIEHLERRLAAARKRAELLTLRRTTA